MVQKTIKFSTDQREKLYDITCEARSFTSSAGIETGCLNVYVRGATAAIMVQENWDKSVQDDVINLLRKLAPKGIWKHDQQDGNGDAHLKAGIIGPSETIPIISGELGLSTWQNIFLCEFDGPRKNREIVLTIIKNEE